MRFKVSPIYIRHFWFSPCWTYSHLIFRWTTGSILFHLTTWDFDIITSEST